MTAVFAVGRAGSHAAGGGPRDLRGSRGQHPGGRGDEDGGETLDLRQRGLHPHPTAHARRWTQHAGILLLSEWSVPHAALSTAH